MDTEPGGRPQRKKIEDGPRRSQRRQEELQPIAMETNYEGRLRKTNVEGDPIHSRILPTPPRGPLGPRCK